MGSGLILLVIVAAWLAVLVPMALRSHESADSLSSVDRFSDAMRVLARRDAAARARASEVAGSARLGQADDDDADDWDDDWDAGWDDSGPGVLTRLREAAARTTARLRGDRGPLTPAARRRRLLAGLVAAAVLTLAGGLLLTPWLLAAHAVSLLLLALYVVQLRRLVLRRQAATRRAPRAARPAPARQPRPAAVAPVETVEVVEVVEAEEVEVVEPAPSPAARHDDPLPAAVGLGAPWSPVPVPPPVYASAPVAPRLARTVDATAAGTWSEQTAGERLPGMEDAPGAEEPPAPRRRAVNDW